MLEKAVLSIIIRLFPDAPGSAKAGKGILTLVHSNHQHDQRVIFNFVNQPIPLFARDLPAKLSRTTAAIDGLPPLGLDIFRWQRTESHCP